MGAEQSHPLFPVLVVAALAPLVSELPIGVRLAPVVVEFLLGVVIGPFGLDLVEPVGFAARLSQFGLAALFFHAGLEVDFGAIRGRPLSLAATGWFLSVLLAVAAGVILHGAGIVVRSR